MSGPTTKQTSTPSFPLGSQAGDEYPGEYYFTDDQHRVVGNDELIESMVRVFNALHHRKHASDPRAQRLTDADFMKILLSLV